MYVHVIEDGNEIKVFVLLLTTVGSVGLIMMLVSISIYILF